MIDTLIGLGIGFLLGFSVTAITAVLMYECKEIKNDFIED